MQARPAAPASRFIPALRFRVLTPLFDPLMRWVVRERRFKPVLVKQASILPGDRVLDVGSGTGTLAVMAKRAHPSAEVVGIDVDPEILRIARRKASRAGMSIRFDRGTATALPYPPASFDSVVSSLVFHHLAGEDKARALAEVFRVLRPGGGLHVADLGEPRTAYTRLASSIFGRMEHARDNVRGLLPPMMRAVGFVGVEETARFTVPFGALVLLRARRPA